MLTSLERLSNPLSSPPTSPEDQQARRRNSSILPPPNPKRFSSVSPSIKGKSKEKDIRPTRKRKLSDRFDPGIIQRIKIGNQEVRVRGTSTSFSSQQNEQGTSALTFSPQSAITELEPVDLKPYPQKKPTLKFEPLAQLTLADDRANRDLVQVAIESMALSKQRMKKDVPGWIAEQARQQQEGFADPQQDEGIEITSQNPRVSTYAPPEIDQPPNPSPRASPPAILPPNEGPTFPDDESFFCPSSFGEEKLKLPWKLKWKEGRRIEDWEVKGGAARKGLLRTMGIGLHQADKSCVIYPPPPPCPSPLRYALVSTTHPPGRIHYPDTILALKKSPNDQNPWFLGVTAEIYEMHCWKYRNLRRKGGIPEDVQGREPTGVKFVKVVEVEIGPKIRPHSLHIFNSYLYILSPPSLLQQLLPSTTISLPPIPSKLNLETKHYLSIAQSQQTEEYFLDVLTTLRELVELCRIFGVEEWALRDSIECVWDLIVKGWRAREWWRDGMDWKEVERDLERWVKARRKGAQVSYY